MVREKLSKDKIIKKLELAKNIPTGLNISQQAILLAERCEIDWDKFIEWYLTKKQTIGGADIIQFIQSRQD